LNIIAIDTSTETLGICLKTEDVLLRISHKANFKHAETIAPWIKKICGESEIKPNDLNLVIVSIGPGSFTGLRIGIATAKGLAMGASCRIVGVPTLDAAAWTHKYYNGTVIPVINAKKNRLYSALYQNGKRISEYLDISGKELLKKTKNLGNVLLTGPYAGDLYKEVQNPENNPNIYIDPDFSLINSYSLLQKGIILYNNNDLSEEVMPLYLRKSEAELNLAKGS
jgi:tRNA threonylcarbamoyladenosine biosynthesis protein TsaB